MCWDNFSYWLLVQEATRAYHSHFSIVQYSTDSSEVIDTLLTLMKRLAEFFFVELVETTTKVG